MLQITDKLFIEYANVDSIVTFFEHGHYLVVILYIEIREKRN